MSDDLIRIAVPSPDSDGAHAVETGVDSVERETGAVADRAVLACEEGAIVLTPAQCRRVATHLQNSAAALEKYHGVSEDE
jgi:hypothetical protein